MPATAPRLDCASLLDTLPVSVFRVAPDFSIDYANAFLAAQLKLAPAEIVGRNCGDLGMEPGLWEALKTELSLAFTTGHPSSFEFVCQHGPERLIEFRLTPELSRNGSVKAVIVAGLTIEELRRLRRALQAQEELFRSFMDHSPAIAWLRDSESRYVFLNKTYLDRYGLAPEDRIGKRLTDVWPADTALQMQENDRAVLAAGKALSVLETIPNPDGTLHYWLNAKFPFTNSDNRTYVGGVGVDVTDEKLAEEQRRKNEQRLMQAQKLESLGLLAAGAAHDFNNLLTLVIGHASLAMRGVDDASPLAENLRAIEEAGQQMSELCQQMLAFAGRGRREPRPVNLNLLAQDTARLLRSMMPKQVAVRFDLAPGLPSVFGDETQFRQVILNLITNAADALADRPGTIELRTSLEIPSPAMLEEAGCEPPPRPFAVLQVSDDGPGMSAEVRSRVFEPFFTTKSAGRGLGLAAVQGIVRAHKGLLTLESAVGRGTTFRVMIPVR